jgi:hypothetical protein
LRGPARIEPSTVRICDLSARTVKHERAAKQGVAREFAASGDAVLRRSDSDLLGLTTRLRCSRQEDEPNLRLVRYDSRHVKAAARSCRDMASRSD